MKDNNLFTISSIQQINMYTHTVLGNTLKKTNKYISVDILILLYSHTFIKSWKQIFKWFKINTLSIFTI